MNIAQDIRNAEAIEKGKAQLDSYCKQILANKHVLARILWHTIKEYQNLPITDVCQYIEDNPKINQIPVFPGETVENYDYLVGSNSEDNVPNEGAVYYDIRFRAFQPKASDVEEILVDVEGQTQFLQNRIEARSVFYCGRMLSAQLSREFKSPKYEKMKKVYSIWICMNVPKRVGNAISKLQLGKEHLLSQVPELEKSYNKMSVILICLNGQIDGKNELTDLLNTIFSKELTCEEKISLLKNKYNIPVEDNLEEELKDMCDYSEYFIQAGLQEGMEKGIKEGIKETTKKTVLRMLKLNFTDEDIMEIVDITEENFLELKTLYCG